MKLKNVLLMGVLVMTMSVSSVYAEETLTEVMEEEPAAEETAEEEKAGGFREKLFGENGLLSEVLPEGTDIDGMIDTAKEQLGEAGREIGEVVDLVVDYVQSEAGEFDIGIDLETAKEYATTVLSQFLGGDDIDFSELEEVFEISEKLDASEYAFIKEKNTGLMDFGDVQIFSDTTVYTDEFDGDEIRVLTSITQSNYTADEENQLHLVSLAEDVVLFTHENNKENGCPVIDAVFAEDGENYSASIEAMCEEVGIPAEDCWESLAMDDLMFVLELKSYMADHPEVTGIEYMGEIRTAEELDQIWDELLDELFPEEPDEMMTEEMQTEEEILR